MRGQFDLGADGVILHGATPAELAPVVAAYRERRPGGRFDGLAREPGSQPDMSTDPTPIDITRPPIADLPELLTPEWVTAALRHSGHDVTVVDVARTQVGTGQMGTSIRLELTFDGDPEGLPPTLVAKLPAGDAAAAVDGRRHLPDRGRVLPPARTDRVGAHTTLLLLRPRRRPGPSSCCCSRTWRPREQGDQIRGCTVDEARVGVVNLAGLHGPRWGDPTLTDHEWMQLIAGDGATMIGLVMRDATDRFIERYGDRLGDADIELLGRIPELLPAWILARPERVAPIHGDYRLDNLLFGEGDDPVATVDWQTITLGLPARDLAYFLSTGLRTVDRRAHEDELIELYHSALVEHGVSGHSLEECRDDYRFSMLQGPLITIVGAAYGAPTERGRRDVPGDGDPFGPGDPGPRHPGHAHR